MVIQHNMISAFASGMMKGVIQSGTKSTERLSSGYRINRSSDDAAGLAISEKMRSQVRDLSYSLSEGGNSQVYMTMRN